jgi:hypothetical protein
MNGKSCFKLLRLVRVDQTAGPERRYDQGQAGIRDGEAALAATQHAGIADHFFAHVPRAMHHDRPGEGVAVGLVESLEPHRLTMAANVNRTGSIGSRGGRIRARLVGEALQPPGVRRVGTPSMSDEMTVHAAVGEIHHVKSRCARGKRKVRNSDEILIGDAVPMALQGIERAPKQTGGYLAVGCSGWPKNGPRACSRGSHPGQSEIEKKTTGKYQDVEFQDG